MVVVVVDEPTTSAPPWPMVRVPELAFTEPFALREAPARVRPPAEIVVPPVVWLPPDRVRVPAPSFSSVPVPVITPE